MADEIIVETTSQQVIEVSSPGPQGPAGAAGTGLETLTSKGDTLFRGETTGERLPIGSVGQVMKVSSGGVPHWANESGAVTSVNGATGAVTVAAAQHASEHEAGEADEIQAMAALVDTDYLPLNGVYFWDGTTTGGRPNFFKTGTRKNTKLQYNSGNNQWQLVRNNVVEAVGVDGPNTVPWEQTWEELVTPTTVSVTRLPLETMVQKLAETGGAATATTSEDGLMSSSDKTKLNGIAAGAEVNVQANWTEANSTSDAFILNKPLTFAPSAHSSSHAAGGSDPIFDQDLNTTDDVVFGKVSVDPDLGPMEVTGTGLSYSGTQQWNVETGTFYDPNGAALDYKDDSVRLYKPLSFAGGDAATNAAATLTNLGAASDDHVHGNLTNDGKLGTTAGLPVVTTTAGAVTTLALGTANQVLRVNSGATGVEFADPAAAGVTSVTGTAPIVSSGGTTPAISITDATTSASGAMSSADKTKLDGIAAGATANSADATLLNRANHTGTQAASTITGLAASATTDTTNASNISTGTLAPARMGSGTPSASNFLRGDGSWQTVTAGVGGSTGATDNVILRSDGTGGATLQDSAFIIADNATASPNNTVNHASIQATGGTTNVSVSIVPKGTGAFMLQVPNAGTGGGNTRGVNAVDLQRDRVAATQVASGDYSFLGAGFYATASGTYSAVCGGREGAASGFYSAVVGGWGQEATGEGSFSGGGDQNRASGIFSSVLGGSCALADRRGLQAHASGMFGSTRGSAQRIRAVLRNRTTNATATELFLEGSSTRFTIPSGKVISALINIVGVKSDGLAVAQYVREVCAKNVAGTSSMVGTVTTIGTDQEDNAATDVSITVSDANDAIQISVTGIASETWRWVASVDAVEVAYGT